MELTRKEAIRLISEELLRAEYKHPTYPDNIFEKVAIVNEEAGEVTKACLHHVHEGGSIEDVKKELIQTAASCIRMLIHL